MGEYFLKTRGKLPVEAYSFTVTTLHLAFFEFKTRFYPLQRLNLFLEQSKDALFFKILFFDKPASEVTFRRFLSVGVVSEPKGEVEEKRAFWSDAAGPNTFLNSLRASSSDAS